jgi:hypothetical protein
MTWRKYLAGSYVFLAAKKEELDVFPSYKYTRLADSNTDTKEKRKKNRSVRASKAMEEEPLPKSSRRQRMESMWMDQMGTYHQPVLTKVSMPMILFSSSVFCFDRFVP